jgi:pantoate--beta-alanine ligase
VSIFVNPTQFGPREDFSQYPRDLNRDLQLLEPTGLAYVFSPEPSDMYPDGQAGTEVVVHGVPARLEGEWRPGHFTGVATVVAKLFNIIRPARAYFGLKDAQQLAVIKKMVLDLNLDLEVIGCPTIRDADGLAMSSRNVYLSPMERETGLCLSRGLFAARALWETGERRAEVLRNRVIQEMNKGAFSGIDYVDVVDPLTFEPVLVVETPAIIAVAARVGTTRLIDNISLQ